MHPSDIDRLTKAMDSLKRDVDSEFRSVKNLLREGFENLGRPNVRNDSNNNQLPPKATRNSHYARIPVVGADNEQQGSSSRGGRKRSLSRGRRGQSRGGNRGGNRAVSRGPPSKVSTQGVTPCPFCDYASCPSPTRCAMTYDWKRRIEVHTSKLLCPQYTCLKSHQGRCWKASTVICDYCDGRHHLAWCGVLAKSGLSSNTGSEASEPKE